jgi:hypothetical protein
MHQTTQGPGREPEAKDISPEPTRDILSTDSRDSSTATELAAAFTPTRRIGHWSVLSVDSSGKRATCQCVCGRIHVLGVEALELGITTSCGCRPPPLQNREAFRLEQSRQKRQRDLGGWKMEGGR